LPPGVAAEFNAAGITQNDFADILRLDPLLSAQPDPERFELLSPTGYSYEPPSQGGSANSSIIALAKVVTNTSGHEMQSSGAVGMTISAETSKEAADLIQSKLKVTNKWEWTSKASTSYSNSVSETASATIGSPSATYGGPTLLLIYVDRIYKTFAFALSSPTVALPRTTGIVLYDDGKPLARRSKVTLTKNGFSQHTYTDPSGRFSFSGLIAAPFSLQASDEAETVMVDKIPGRQIVIHRQH
jgi:hypothetical protein